MPSLLSFWLWVTPSFGEHQLLWSSPLLCSYFIYTITTWPSCKVAAILGLASCAAWLKLSKNSQRILPWHQRHMVIVGESGVGPRRKMRPRRRLVGVATASAGTTSGEAAADPQQSSSRESSASNHNECSALLPASRQTSVGEGSEKRYLSLRYTVN